MIKVWKEVRGYGGRYIVSTEGEIYDFVKKSVVKPFDNGHGRFQVMLVDEDGVKHNENLARVVLTAFVPNPNNYTDAHHIDEDKSNNALSNLGWLPHIVNNNEGTHNARVAISRERPTPVLQYSVSGEFIDEYPSINDATKAVGGKYTTQITGCLDGSLKTAYGYCWLPKYPELFERKKNMFFPNEHPINHLWE